MNIEADCPALGPLMFKLEAASGGTYHQSVLEQSQKLNLVVELKYEADR